MENNAVRTFVLDLPEKTFQEFYLAVLWRGLFGKATSDPTKPEMPASYSNYPFPNEKVLEFLRRNEKIAAIKEYRTLTNLGLRESKDICDWFGAQLDLIAKIQRGNSFFNKIEQEAIRDGFDEFAVRSKRLRSEMTSEVEDIKHEIKVFRLDMKKV